MSKSRKPEPLMIVTDSGHHASIEGAQHGAKSLEQFLEYARTSDAAGAQPSNFMLEIPDSNGKFQKPKEIKDLFSAKDLHLDGISAHCPFWVQGSAWTETKAGNAFIPKHILHRTAKGRTAWMESYLLRLMDLAAELGVKTMPMFWGVLFGWEMATGYPWGFWGGPDKKGKKYDLLKEGQVRFVKMTARLRAHAKKLGIYLCHEIHPGTAASTADDFNMLVKICGGDPTLAVNADPSHCWEGEDWETRFLKVADRVYAAHVKNFVIRGGFPLRCMEPEWPKRAMQFTDLASGQINLDRYVELLIQIGYPARYCQLYNTASAPLVVEAESPYKELDHCSADGICYVRERLCYPFAMGSFETGMGA